MKQDYPNPKNIAATKTMQANRSKNTKPEIKLRRALSSAGIRGYRLHYDVAGRPDIAFVGRKIAVFLHGCFWHRCPYCKLSLPKNNPEYWTAKFARNKERDRTAAKILRSSGWKVLTFWECRLKKNPEKIVEKIAEAIR